MHLYFDECPGQLVIVTCPSALVFPVCDLMGCIATHQKNDFIVHLEA